MGIFDIKSCLHNIFAKHAEGLFLQPRNLHLAESHDARNLALRFFTVISKHHYPAFTLRQLLNRFTQGKRVQNILFPVFTAVELVNKSKSFVPSPTVL